MNKFIRIFGWFETTSYWSCGKYRPNCSQRLVLTIIEDAAVSCPMNKFIRIFGWFETTSYWSCGKYWGTAREAGDDCVSENCA
jgi:hypothetical protein